MKSRVLNLGILLLTILLAVLMGSFTLLVNSTINNLFGVGLSIILLLIIITFISYLFIDLYNTKEDKGGIEEEEGQRQFYR